MSTNRLNSGGPSVRGERRPMPGVSRRPHPAGAERSFAASSWGGFLHVLQGHWNSPIADDAKASRNGDLSLRACVFTPDGKTVLNAHEWAGPLDPATSYRFAGCADMSGRNLVSSASVSASAAIFSRPVGPTIEYGQGCGHAAVRRTALEGLHPQQAPLWRTPHPLRSPLPAGPTAMGGPAVQGGQPERPPTPPPSRRRTRTPACPARWGRGRRAGARRASPGPGHAR